MCIKNVLNIADFADGKFIRFLIIGCSNFVVSFSIFQLCLHSGINIPFKVSISQLISYSVATAWSFYWNKKITFRDANPALVQGIKFVILQTSLAISSSVLIGLSVDTLNFSPTISWFVIMSVVTVVNFLFMKSWVFKKM